MSSKRKWNDVKFAIINMNNLNVNLNMRWGTFVSKKCIRRYASEKNPPWQ